MGGYRVPEPNYKDLLKRARTKIHNIEDLEKWERAVRRERWLFEENPMDDRFKRRLRLFFRPPPPVGGTGSRKHRND